MSGRVEPVAVEDSERAPVHVPSTPRRLTAVPAGRRQPQMVPIASLLAADSPRLSGLDESHTLRLAETDATLPPILVHRPTMRVIDGAHRVAVALRRGLTEIEVDFFDGSLEDAFVLAVQINTTHGLPLSLADRRAAAERVIRSHPEWSDRTIASTTGLAARTVSGIRDRANANVPQLHARVGRDGRVRPLDAAAGRQLASEMLAARPDASLRQIAQAAGISPGTARDVRDRVRRGEDPVLPRRGEPRSLVDGAPRTLADRERSGSGVDMASTLQVLSKDPRLRLSESGRQLLRWLHMHAIDLEDGAKLVNAVPSHCIVIVARLARGCAEAWLEVSRELEQRGPDQ